MVYELRIYHQNSGKQADIHARFRDHTLGLFKKYGVNTYDFWDDATGAERIYYINKFDQVEDRAKTFDKMQVAPEWKAVVEESHKNGPIVEKVDSCDLCRVYRVKPNYPEDKPLYELRIYECQNGAEEAIMRSYLKTYSFDAFEKYGATVCDAFEDIDGKSIIVYILAFKDMDAREKCFAAMAAEKDTPRMVARAKLAPLVREQSYFMKRVDYIIPEWE
jgi:hypothetical protein